MILATYIAILDFSRDRGEQLVYCHSARNSRKVLRDIEHDGVLAQFILFTVKQFHRCASVYQACITVASGMSRPCEFILSAERLRAAPTPSAAHLP